MFVLIMVLISFFGNAEEKPCCKICDKFASLSEKEEFKMEHSEPIAYLHQSENGMMTKIKSNDGKDINAFELKANSNKFVFVIHEWWGLNDHIKKEAEDIYNELGGKVNVIALDLYDGEVATDRDNAGKLMQKASSDASRIQNIFNGAINYAGDKAEIATLGWCFGGGMSMQLSLAAGRKAKACVMYYGQPIEDQDKIAEFKAPVLFVFAKQDEWINERVKLDFKKNMDAAGKSLQIEEYDANHAFANPSNPGFKSDLAKDALNKSIGFIRKNLNIK